jgi:hypothetical protein
MFSNGMSTARVLLVIHHLNVRVAWHDNRWNGGICLQPSRNSFCLDLARIRKERDDDAEESLSGQAFADLAPSQLPPCIAESGGFMNDREWWRIAAHPYQEIKKTQVTHGHLKPTRIGIPPFSTFAVPFLWMLRESQEQIDDSLAEPLPPDEDSPFDSPWVFSRERQQALGDLFFGRLTAGRSLVFFYTKSGHPLGDAINRLVVGVAQIDSISPTLNYDSAGGTSYPMWDRLIRHSARPDGHEGFILPYHDYLESTEDPDEDLRRIKLLEEIAVVPESAHIKSFSYAGEHSTPDVALSTLVRTLDSVRNIRRHGVAKGPWDRREEWINSQIAVAWSDRGAFPGTGSVLEALGMRLGTAMLLELMSTGVISAKDNPWVVIDAILRGKRKAPHKAYTPDISNVAHVWAKISDEQRSMITLLSRFSITPVQASRWLNSSHRTSSTRSSVSDREIIENPYRISELDLGDAEDHAISLGVIDRGLMPDSTIAAMHPVPEPSKVESALDKRRVRAALVSILRHAAENGDALLAQDDALTKLGSLDIQPHIMIPTVWLSAHASEMKMEIEQLPALIDKESGVEIPCLQLVEMKNGEDKLRSILSKRAEKNVPSLNENWKELLSVSIKESDTQISDSDERYRRAIQEQSEALETITTRRLSTLVGRAGTGKTTVLGALLKSKSLSAGGVLFLAPTGKARVRLGQKTGATAMTVAQFLFQLGRYDGARQRPLFAGKEQYRKEKTVVIDECSMLTMDDLVAVLLAFDLGHVERLILVGDPNQLPPIGVGRPFADLVEYLDTADSNGEVVGGAIARLTTELRTTAGAPSDALRLASWYTREVQAVDADRVLSDLELGGKFNDLQIEFWKSPEELRNKIGELFVSCLGLTSPNDVPGFNTSALGLTEEGWVPFDDHNGADRFQILSPVRAQPHGVIELNRWIQKQFRAQTLKAARQPWGVRLGDEEIVWGDKVILNRNGKTKGWNGKLKSTVEDYLANGEIGVVAPPPKTFKNALNVAFSNRPDVRFAYRPSQFATGSGPLELAYALTVHKSQGSEFGTVFVVLPKHSRLITRELLYTALTRSRDRLVLLIEGTDSTFLYELTRPERSETARRNTNIFTGGVRRDEELAPYAEHLVHRTSRGELVRSKSELVIANFLFNANLNYQYERPLEGSSAPGRLRPDFSFIDDAGDLIIWEHLGMLDRPDYLRSWEWKKDWYESNNFHLGKNLFTTSEENGLDMKTIASVAEHVRAGLS